MNDLLKALYKESRTMSDKVYKIRLYLQKQTEVVSLTPYTAQALENARHRLAEVKVAIDAINKYRKEHKIIKPATGCSGTKNTIMYKHNTTGEEITTEAFNALSAEEQANYSLVEQEATAGTEEAATGTNEEQD